MSHEMLQFIAGERRHGTSENVVVITTSYDRFRRWSSVDVRPSPGT